MYTKEGLKKYIDTMKETINDYSKTDIEQLHIVISSGNRKIGRVMNVSIPAGMTCGNCTGCLKYCYDIKACLQYKNVMNARKHSDFTIWTYTKRYDIVNAYIAAGNTIPANFHIMFSEWDGMPLYNPYNMPIFTCKLKAGNKNHNPEFFDTLHQCPGNCDICKTCGRGCIVGESTFANEH